LRDSLREFDPYQRPQLIDAARSARQRESGYAYECNDFVCHYSGDVRGFRRRPDVGGLPDQTEPVEARRRKASAKGVLNVGHKRLQQLCVVRRCLWSAKEFRL